MSYHSKFTFLGLNLENRFYIQTHVFSETLRCTSYIQWKYDTTWQTVILAIAMFCAFYFSIQKMIFQSHVLFFFQNSLALV